METNDNSRWAAERLAQLDPAWTPDVMRAREALGRRSESRVRLWMRSRTLTAAAAAAGLAVAAVALPQGRAVAQELLFRLFLNRVDVVRVDLSDAPFETEWTGSGGQRVVAGLGEAEAQSGFRPHLPPPGSWPGKPTLSVIGAMRVEQTVRTADLRSALARAGASEVDVPEAWDGMTVRAQMGPLVAADYAGEIQVLQSRPVELLLPAGLPLPQFAEVAFRSVGLSWWEARALARRYVAQPSLLIGIPNDEPARIEDVSLRQGSGLLVEELDDDGTMQRVTLVFAAGDRIYAVMSPSREVCLRVAGLLP